MDGLGGKELALFQVLFEPVRAPWAEHMMQALTRENGSPFFANRPDLLKGAELKASSPLFAVVLRLASSAAETARTWEIITDMAAALSALSRPGSNYLVPFDDAGYPMREHEADDPVVAVQWPVIPTVVSDKDRSWPTFASQRATLLQRMTL